MIILNFEFFSNLFPFPAFVGRIPTSPIKDKMRKRILSKFEKNKTMKKNLLIACLALSTTSFAQEEFNDGNSPQIGNSTLMYVLDTNASNMANVTGTGVTWDYSGTAGVYNETKTITAVSPASTSEGADFPNAAVAIEIPGFVTTYNTSSMSDYVSEGFSFTEATFGTVNAVYSTDNGMLMMYPYAFGGSINDNLSGVVKTTSYPDFPCTGTVKTTVDGEGTLILNSSTTLTNVLRMKVQDSVNVNAGIIGTVIMKRIQYEYYHHATSNLPVLVHSSIVVSLGGDQTTGLVLSAYAPDDYLNVNDEAFSSVSVYPNPATENIAIKGLTEDATVVIYDLSGNAVKTIDLGVGTSTVSVSDLLNGSYVLKATTASGTFTKKIAVL